jgi:DNA-binding transcriptional MerR regulator
MDILKPKDVSKMLGVIVKTLQNWDSNNKLKAFRIPKTGRRYYTKEQLNNIMERRS